MDTATNVHVVEVTPRLARSYLENSAGNRPLSIRTVQELARAILNGEWQLNGESIKFDKLGNLIDGQHRCQAIIKADRAVQTFVLFDLPSDSFKTLDTGKKRNNADTLGLLGFGNPIVLAATCRFAVNFQTNQLRSNEIVTNIRMEHFIDENPDILDSVHFVKNVKADSLLPGAVAGGLHFLMSQRDEDDAELFFRDLGKGSMLAANDPVYLLREKLLYYRGRHGAKLTRRDSAALVVKAWNYRRTGKIVKRLTWAKKNGEDFPVIQ